MPAQLIRRITKRTLLSLNVALNMVFLLSIWLVSFSKPFGWVTGFVGLAIPYLILLQLIFLLFWLFAKPSLSVFSVICLVIGWKQILLVVAFQTIKPFAPTKTESIWRIADWNIRSFNGVGAASQGMAVLKKQISDAIQQNKPDIICLQEFFI